jgi:hypothetical protein
LGPILENLEFLEFRESLPLLEVVSDLAKHDPVKLESYTLTIFSRLEASDYRVSKSNVAELQLFLKAIYLSEIMIQPKALSKRIRGTVQDIVSENLKKRQIAIELHRRYLNSSRLFRKFAFMFQ